MAKLEPKLIFPVISDVHILPDYRQAVKKLSETILQLNQLFPRQDAFVVVGDLTEEGSEEQYGHFMRTMEKNKLPNAHLLIGIGNHDYWNDLPARNAQDRFLSKTGMESIYYTKVINGYYFIILGSEDGCTEGTYTLKQIMWLDEQLKMAADSCADKPIFVFHHHPLTETVYGSSWGIVENRLEFYDVLKKYPQVISFTGHTHYTMDHPKIIHQKDFTSVGTSTSGYLFLDEGRIQGEIPEGANNLNQAWVIEAYEDKIVLHRRDIFRNEWIGTPFEIKCPVKREDFCFTDNRDNEAPYFEEDSTLTVIESKTTKETLTISFTQAKDNLFVQDYEIVIRDKETKQMIKRALSYSEFYNKPIPNPLEVAISDLDLPATFDVQVWAFDAFENKSKNSLKVIGQFEKESIV